MFSFSCLVLLFWACLSLYVVAIKVGDTCGVKSADFFQSGFAGQFLVAGENGCTLSGGEENCYCAPYYEDERLGEWRWQCNVQFGPIPTKTCPPEVPVSGNYLQGPDCNVTVHPTGWPKDPVCSYSNCDEGGNSSAVCACIEKENYGLGTGVQWVCLHSTCSCGINEDHYSSAAFVLGVGEIVLLSFSAAVTFLGI